MKKFKNKYRTTSHRKPNWNYASNAAYFITLVTQNRECNLGHIIKTDIGAQMKLSDFGKIVKSEWIKSFEIRTELFLDEYIIMPNHIHAIIILNGVGVAETHGRASQTQPRASLQPQPRASQQSQTQFIRLPKSISSFIAGFKSAVNTKIDDYIDEQNLEIPKYNRKNHFFQPNYHDRIVHSIFDHHRIANYIKRNPEKWNAG